MYVLRITEHVFLFFLCICLLLLCLFDSCCKVNFFASRIEDPLENLKGLFLFNKNKCITYNLLII